MLKLSPALKAQIGTVSFQQSAWSPAEFERVLEKIEQEAAGRGLARTPGLAIVMAVTMTAGSYKSMEALSRYIIRTTPRSGSTKVVEFMREVGIICMAMNGAPQTIVLLTAFRESFPVAVKASLREAPSRHRNESGAALIDKRGRVLWEQIHQPFAAKLERQFGQAHPDLPFLIVRNIYGDLFSNPVCEREQTVGRITTSLSAIACLRARPGFALQVFDHVCGLKNAWRDGAWRFESHVGSEESVEWLLSDAGCMWVLKTVDELMQALASTDSDSAGRRARL